MIELISIVMLIFGILQIILFFKIWGMTNDVKELKDLYATRSGELYSLMDKLVYTIKKQSQPETHTEKPAITISKESTKEERKPDVVVKQEKILPVIDENSDEFKQKLRKWKILKSKGFTEQAIREYIAYTERDYNSAAEFINGI